MSIESIQARVEAASLGPWRATGGMDAYVHRPDGSRMNIGDAVYHPEYTADANLIAHSRTDIPLLLKVAEAAKEYRDSEQVQMLNDTKYDEPKWERQRQAKKALDAALAELEGAE